mmetsp:Transcript_1525/g.2327  ORF Transcript_1525/g.2327 Transcript_1525/m.2327 type:complete len:219 (+) Transcript_1525:292-948(+)
MGKHVCKLSKGKGYVLVVKCTVCIDGCYLGASIAVNGTCLTATAFDDSTVTFGVAPETLRCTNLGSLNAGSKVNMERAAQQGSRNSGHYVQGHVDATGEIVKKWREGESLWVKIKVPKNLITLIVKKGFIAIDGTSLTVCEVNAQESSFTFMLVQYTQTKIIVPHKEEGEKVNVELDVLGKYVAQSVAAINDRVDSLESKIDSALSKLETRITALEAK